MAGALTAGEAAVHQCTTTVPHASGVDATSVERVQDIPAGFVVQGTPGGGPAGDVPAGSTGRGLGAGGDCDGLCGGGGGDDEQSSDGAFPDGQLTQGVVSGSGCSAVPCTLAPGALRTITVAYQTRAHGQ